MRKKFRRGTFVKVDVSKECAYMSHFDPDFFAIVTATYADLYGGNDFSSYDVVMLNEEMTKGINQIAWYSENQLTALDFQDYDKVEAILEDWAVKSEDEEEN